jgi:hypothetical protein
MSLRLKWILIGAALLLLLLFAWMDRIEVPSSNSASEPANSSPTVKGPGQAVEKGFIRLTAGIRTFAGHFCKTPNRQTNRHFGPSLAYSQLSAAITLRCTSAR